ncbi:MAG: type I restriction enzyme HsdR N-terminal domain-containing protein [candidate division KSB1 bacterium]|nr:type I restriction enzyme HsdR N-terminal domain-containing protein [candidate division KSB1 bacterium]MDQ7063572.1 type I restriction enzyme HsdR N-terminal domain-containing protein [candidate division KSB1 bacterium]
MKRSKRIQSRLQQHLPALQQGLQELIKRQANERDTVSFVRQVLAELFGYDHFKDITAEFLKDGRFCDLAIRFDDQVHILCEVRAVAMDLTENHLSEVIRAGMPLQVNWYVLTNGREWQFFRLRGEQLSKYDRLLDFDFLELQASDAGRCLPLYLFSKESVLQNEHERYYRDFRRINRYVLAALLLEPGSLQRLSRAIRRLLPDVRFDEAYLREILENEVLQETVLVRARSDEIQSWLAERRGERNDANTNHARKA